MSDKEKLYHRVNVYLIPSAVLAGILLGIMTATAAQNSGSRNVSPILIPFVLLLYAVGGSGALWVVISGLINENVKTKVIKGVKGAFKSFMGMFAAIGWAVCLLAPFEMVAAFFIILLVFGLIYAVWWLGLIVLAIYLYTTSSKALKTNTSIFF